VKVAKRLTKASLNVASNKESVHRRGARLHERVLEPPRRLIETQPTSCCCVSFA
jgi:hypothetical protein